ncbi:MAG: hypothetical protein ACTSXJ_06950 [Candidatus Baldrarchaeia archaeon]
MKQKVVRISVVGPKDSYPCYTGYLWLFEIKETLEENTGCKIVIEWENQKVDVYPQFKIEDKVVLRGLPSDAGFLLEVLHSYLRRDLRSERKTNSGPGGI